MKYNEMKFVTDEITDYGSGGQSPPTNDSINEQVQRLEENSKTSLTPSDGHKIVIEVSEDDSENSKGAQNDKN